MSQPVPAVVSSSIAYHGVLFDVEQDELAYPGAGVALRDIIRHPGAVAMVPVGSDGRLLLVRQYRHATGRRLLEIPAGTLEPGEQPMSTAERELQEEVGQRPGAIRPLGGFFVAPGYSSEYIHLFECSELEPSVLDGDLDEDIEVEAYTLEEALAAIDSGEICDAKSIIGILRYAGALHR